MAERQARHCNASFTPVTQADGSVTGVIVVVIDVTERRALLEAEREARVRADFLAHAGAILDASLDYEETLRSVVQIAIPEVADWCAVSVLDDAGVLQEVATRTSTRASASRPRAQPPLPGRPGRGQRQLPVARSGETAYVREVTDEMLAAGIPDPRASTSSAAWACARSSIRCQAAVGRRHRSRPFANNATPCKQGHVFSSNTSLSTLERGIGKRGPSTRVGTESQSHRADRSTRCYRIHGRQSNRSRTLRILHRKTGRPSFWVYSRLLGNG